MKVKELIEKLKKEDPERLVICQRDAEGNDYSPLERIWAGAYLPDTTWCGGAGLEKLTPADQKAGCSEEDVIKGGDPAIFLVPIY